jgi:ankyrin repeat protein
MQQYGGEIFALNGSTGAPALTRPLSRPEVINPENSRPSPTDLQRMHTKQRDFQKKAMNDDSAFPPSAALSFATVSNASDNQSGTPSQSNSATSGAGGSIASTIISSFTRRKRTKQPLVCQFCKKKLTPKVSESGDFLLADTLKRLADGSTSPTDSPSLSIADLTADLCTCMHSRTASPTETSVSSKEDRQSSLTSQANSSFQNPTYTSLSASKGVGDSGSFSNFENASLRENYFHPDDPRRKSKVKKGALPPPDLSSEAQKKLEDERTKNEAELFHACETGDVETVLRLVEPPTDENGLSTGPPAVDVRAKTIDNWTALHYAARYGRLEVVQALLSSLQPLDINCRTKSNWSPLMMAADQGNVEVVKVLVKYGAAIHIVNSDGKSAIFLARESGHHEIAQLLTHASSVRHKRHTLLAGHQQEDENERILNYELFRACEFGDLSKVKHLLSLDEQNNTVEHVSRRSANQPDDCNSLPERPRLRYSVDVCAKGIDHWTALHFAARKGRAAVVELLLQHDPKPDVNAVTKNGWTPLMMACDKGFVEVCRLLLTNGADTSIRSLDGYTAMSVALEGNYTDIVTLLNKYSNQNI